MARKFLICFILLTVIAINLKSQDTIPCKIIFYRNERLGNGGIPCKIFINNVFTVDLLNKSYFEYQCNPGSYNVSVFNIPNAFLIAKIKEGETKFIEFDYIKKNWIDNPYLTIMNEQAAYQIINAKDMVNLNKPYVRPKYRIGINMDIGYGLQQIPVIILTNGEESTISFGGGLGFGFKYAREFNRYFDLAFDGMYKMTELVNRPDNASFTFNRGQISITPSLIIPINDGNRTRIKLGAGVNYNFSSKLDVDCSQLIGGFKESFKYSNSAGIHTSIIFEINLSHQCSIITGLKYYYIRYKYEGDYLYDDRLLNPDGSGIDMMMGMYYHF